MINAYNRPTPNMLRTCHFCRFEMFSFRMMGIGMDRMVMSKTMLMAAAAHPTALILMHLPLPGWRHCFQKYHVGVHWKAKTKAKMIR